MIRRAPFALLATCVAACSSNSNSATSGSYAVTFPSTAAAIGADSVQMLVFDASDGGVNLCTDLVIARRSKQALPPTLAESKAVTPCEMAAGKGQVAIPYGPRALLVVAQKEGADYLLGCATEEIGAGSAPVAVQLSLASATSAVLVTSCAALSDYCASRCE